MKINKITDSLRKGFNAISDANTDRKFVRQVDTGKRNLNNMCKSTKERYRKCVQEAGHYSVNPIARFIAYTKSLISHLS